MTSQQWHCHSTENVHRASYRVTAEGVSESWTDDLRFLNFELSLVILLLNCPSYMNFEWKIPFPFYLYLELPICVMSRISDSNE